MLVTSLELSEMFERAIEHFKVKHSNTLYSERHKNGYYRCYRYDIVFSKVILFQSKYYDVNDTLIYLYEYTTLLNHTIFMNIICK